MFLSFQAARELVLTKLYETIYSSDEAEFFLLGEITELCSFEFSAVFAKKVVAKLIEDKLLEAQYFEADEQLGYTISHAGIVAAEKVISRGDAVPKSLSSIPASDRIVTLDHNSAEAVEAIQAVEEAAEAVRTSNTLPDAEKGWIRSQLESGIDLLKRAKAITLAAVKSLLLAPLTAAFKGVSEDQIREVIERAIQALRTWMNI